MSWESFSTSSVMSVVARMMASLSRYSAGLAWMLIKSASPFFFKQPDFRGNHDGLPLGEIAFKGPAVQVAQVQKTFARQFLSGVAEHLGGFGVGIKDIKLRPMDDKDRIGARFEKGTGIFFGIL